MDGYTAYIQYLENIRKELKNCEMECVRSRNILKIFKRVDDIEDLAYIDIVFKEAGLDISFFGEREFLSKKVKKREKSLMDSGEFFNSVELLDFEEEEYLRKLDELSKLKKFDICEFRDSSEDSHSYSEYVEKNKAELEKIWDIMQSITKREEEKERKEEEKRQWEDKKQKEMEKRKSEIIEETDIGGEEFSKFDISEIIECAEKKDEIEEEQNILDDSIYAIDFEAVQKNLEEKAKREEKKKELEEKRKELDEKKKELDKKEKELEEKRK